ncbi:DUF3857 domain-containing protein [Salinimicrobium flavum]|uniref:DUF3857 domain-containing protein n=1 Tax=Salinimicrobium flavum TaxID=1737065 RepID=A0ABW5ISS4_9FLAO
MQKIFFIVLCLSFHLGAEAQDFKFGKVSIEEVEEKVHPKDEEANAAVLFREQNVYYEYSESTGFTLITDVHERVKIYNKDGFDWATEEIILSKNGNDKEKVSSIKAFTYNVENGKLTSEKLKKNGIFEEEVSNYRDKTKLTMPAVTEGSVIEYQYSIRSPFLTSIDVTPLQYTVPINRLETELIIPEFFGFKKYFNTKSPISVPVQETKKSFTHRTTQSSRRLRGSTMNSSMLEFLQNVYTIAADDIPALKNEEYVDYLHNYAAFIKWELMYTKFPNSTIENYSQDWEGVTKSIYNDVGLKKDVTRKGFFEDDVDTRLAGVTSPHKKAKLIYALVKEKVKWNEYNGFTSENGGRSAYKKGEGNVGDINLLLTSMLNYAGLKASPVLVSTKSNGIPVFPTRNGFNYVITAIEFPNELILLDATDKNAAFGELPARARNWQGRIIREDNSSDWVSLIPSKQSEEIRTLNFKLGDDLVLRGKSINIHRGLFAKSYREKYSALNEESYLENLEKDKGNIKIDGVQQENLSKVEEDVRVTYEFELEQGVDLINDKVYLRPMMFNALKENPFKANERSYPVFFDFPMMKTNTVNIMIPEGYEVESAPQSMAITINDGEGNFRFIVTQNRNFLRIESVFDLKNIVYIPEHYNALKEFYALMVEKETEAIVLRKI